MVKRELSLRSLEAAEEETEHAKAERLQKRHQVLLASRARTKIKMNVWERRFQREHDNRRATDKEKAADAEWSKMARALKKRLARMTSTTCGDVMEEDGRTITTGPRRGARASRRAREEARARAAG